MRSSTDKLFLVLTGVFVGGLALVAGAISFAHMTELATRHDQTGWKAYAFPVSVDGLELVASLYILAHRRAGRRPGSLPWAALLVGTAASLAANVAVGGHDLVGRALAGWPAISLLVSIKLLFSMFDHGYEDQKLVRDDQRPSADGPAVPGTVRRTGPDDEAWSGTVPATWLHNGQPSRAVTDMSTAGAIGQDESAPDAMAAAADLRAVAHLIPAARAARTALARDGRPLSRDRLADAMRDDGHGVSNASASLLLKALRADLAPPASRPEPPLHGSGARADSDEIF